MMESVGIIIIALAFYNIPNGEEISHNHSTQSDDEDSNKQPCNCFSRARQSIFCLHKKHFIKSINQID